MNTLIPKYSVVLIVIAAAAFATSTYALAPSAEATEFIYKVEGSKLEAKITKEIISRKITPKFVFEGGVFTIECGQMKLETSPQITGGKPGTLSSGIGYTECSASELGKTCESASVSSSVTGELVEIVNPEQYSKLMAWQLGNKNSVFATVVLVGCITPHQSRQFLITGDVAASSKFRPNSGEREEIPWFFPEKVITEVKNSANKTEKLELKAGSVPVVVKGELGLKLAKVKKWGIF
jgi:hypothetical protein